MSLENTIHVTAGLLSSLFFIFEPVSWVLNSNRDPSQA